MYEMVKFSTKHTIWGYFYNIILIILSSLIENWKLKILEFFLPFMEKYVFYCSDSIFHVGFQLCHMTNIYGYIFYKYSQYSRLKISGKTNRKHFWF